MRCKVNLIALWVACAARLWASEGPAAPKANTDLVGDFLPEGVSARLGTIRLRHLAPVTVTTWAPDGKLLASGGMDDWIRLWDPKTGKQVRQMRGASGITALTFLNEGKTLASAEQQGFIRLWDVESGRELRQFGSGKDRVTHLALAHDNRSLFSAGSERIVRQWLTDSGKELKAYSAHKSAILALAVAADGKEIRTAGDDGSARVFDAVSGAEIRTFDTILKRGPVTSLHAAFSRDGKVLAHTRPDGAVILYDADAGKVLHSLATMPYRPNGLEFSATGKLLAVAHAAGSVRIYGTVSGKEIRTFDNPVGSRGLLAFAPDGQILAAAAGDHALRLWNVANAREALSLPGHYSPVQSLCFSRDGTHLFTIGKDRTFRVWDLVSGKSFAKVDVFSSSDQQVAVGSGSRGFLTLGPPSPRDWTLKDGTELSEKLRWGQLTTGIIAVSPDGKTMARRRGSDLIVIEAATGNVLVKLGEARDALMPKPTFQVASIVLSSDGKLLAATGILPSTPRRSTLIQVWNITTRQLTRQIRPEQDGAVSVAFSPDSRLLAVGGIGIKLHETATGLERQIVAPGIRVAAFAFSPDGRYIVAGLHDGGVQCFEVFTGLRVGQLGEALGAVHAVAVAPEGTAVAFAGADAAVYVWSKLPWREPRPAARVRLDEAELDALWKTLAQANGSLAHQAIWALAGAPEQSVPFLKKRVKPAEADHAKRVELQVRQLDSVSFAIRQSAARELELFGDDAELALRAALNNGPSLELRRRIEEILGRIKDGPLPAKLQTIRALEVLEHAATEDSRRVLTGLAEGGAGHWLTEGARHALARMQRGKP